MPRVRTFSVDVPETTKPAIRMFARAPTLPRTEKLTNRAVFGDGPVEMREARRRGAYAVGVASDEVRRHGLNLHKRARLIRAGADLIIPDYGRTDTLLARLGFR